MAKLIPIASGKGGVGKTVVSANLGLMLAASGKTTIVADLDLGASNLHTLLGIKNRYSGLSSITNRTENSMEALLRETGQPKLFFIPGDNLLPGAANYGYAAKNKIVKKLARLQADYIILDLGSGSSANVVDLFLCSNSGVIVIIPEITSILNAYGLLKSVLFRSLYRAFPPKSLERRVITDFAAIHFEGSADSIRTLYQRLAESSSPRAAETIAALQELRPRVVINRGRGADDARICAQLRKLAWRYLALEIEYSAYLPFDEHLISSIAQRRPAVSLYPDSPFSLCVKAAAERIVQTAPSESNVMSQGGGFADLERLVSEGLAAIGLDV